MSKYVERLRGMTLSELADERGFLPGGTREDDELQAEIARRQKIHADLLAASKELREAFLDGCGDATKGPKRKRLVDAGAALELAIDRAEGKRE